ncbi:flagellar biosynthesis anti-sigma factor FlgM [Thalassobacillus pellis]|uniref:flagellar biosynthesis anti-sigma factor FlgM n=1 Tax=Thalassobacillus pellis TaxID=748008 RepID=UPI00195F83F5|nr:flagellar biosynthesis anti-sigma factor FlgM [Thalassobacillus pellis]MBM7551436.1 negative regulator of flagellin synthesis FlgM [Thalassobacillus pellis]
MKINGTNQSNFNPYQKPVNKQAEVKKAVLQEDNIQISSQAKQLQESTKVQAEREKKVAELKQAIDNGSYKVDSEAAAKKMIEFWNNRK